jgi:hypothetical protein
VIDVLSVIAPVHPLLPDLQCSSELGMWPEFEGVLCYSDERFPYETPKFASLCTLT